MAHPVTRKPQPKESWPASMRPDESKQRTRSSYDEIRLTLGFSSMISSPKAPSSLTGCLPAGPNTASSCVKITPTNA